MSLEGMINWIGIKIKMKSSIFIVDLYGLILSYLNERLGLINVLNPLGAF